MKLIVGLGNPGPKYAHNRHNIGFMAVDRIADQHGFSTPRSKFQGDVFDGTIAGEKTILLKPMTYMNESGRSVGEVMRFYKIDLADVIVFHDELDLAPGKLKAKIGGGHAGHNGLRSIMAHCGEAFVRIRMGIGHPGDKALVHNHVLGDFAKADESWLDTQLEAIAKNMRWLVKDDSTRFMTAVAQAQQPKKSKNEMTKNTTSETKEIDNASPTQFKTVAEKTSEGSMADSLKSLLGLKK